MTLTELPGFHHFVDLTRLDPHGVVVDAGACIGGFIDALRKLGFRGTIHALECNPTNLADLYLQDFRGVTIHDRALTALGLPATFYEFVGLREWGNVTGLNLGTRHNKLRRIVNHDVLSVAINDLFSYLGEESIGYLKMDIEGSEHEVVMEMSEDSARRIDQLSFEHHPGSDPDQLVARLVSLGFVALHLDGEIYAARA